MLKVELFFLVNPSIAKVVYSKSSASPTMAFWSKMEQTPKSFNSLPRVTSAFSSFMAFKLAKMIALSLGRDSMTCSTLSLSPFTKNELDSAAAETTWS
eukprot:CAMPEP_0172461858 /NCGR_PEP_ID=MMETSP1065-20121228/41944_1 /TAXON_ID=265537 /ORGANISM="Amphiprora paludosa, Strain CCMP125" /LENGTH=97 /DNA_ID=CAMNT_0013217331 /DNA_START=141 /DNA_END=431 /DNA_ORIENTATION=+